MTPPKEQNNFPITISKERDICGWLDKEFKVIVLKEAQQAIDSPDKQKNEIRKRSHEQNKKFNKKNFFF